ncbi:AbrB/MazE/SpoVT family DNA-binding domain-containing protein [Bacillus sp. FSL K6-6540]|uniref:AbrB/MazE/SpoVT family DNA-binding domain-containing protein n=1 Tax=Bacillus sp. FSL K6-6540 TaxID=2921512 RepID=UPI0030FD1C5F
MKVTGIVRRIDDLGRVVIPKEVQKDMHVDKGDPLEMYQFGDSVVLRKHEEDRRPPFEGKVMDSEYAYQRSAFVRPIEHHYDNGEASYIKYGCPVCEILGNVHQVLVGTSNCPLCNVNLLWEIES